MVEVGRRSLVADWLKKVKKEVLEPEPWLLSDVRPFPRFCLWFYLCLSLCICLWLLSSVRPSLRGWQRFYKAFGDSEKNFSIDTYIVDGFEVWQIIKGEVGVWWEHRFDCLLLGQKHGVKGWGVNKNQDWRENGVNLRLRRVACWMGREQSPGGTPMSGQSSQAGLIWTGSDLGFNWFDLGLVWVGIGFGLILVGFGLVWIGFNLGLVWFELIRHGLKQCWVCV